MTSELIFQIDSLLALDAKGCLVPHGVGALARELLERCQVELNTRAVPDVPELVRYSAVRRYGREEIIEKDEHGEYVRHDQVVDVIADLKSELYDMRDDRDLALKWRDHDKERAEASEAKLAQIKAQEPVAWMHPEARWTDVSKQEVAVHCKVGTYPLPLYASPVSDSLKAECDRYKEALGLCQRTLAMIIDPKSIVSTTSIIAFASATEAEAKARAALNPSETRT